MGVRGLTTYLQSDPRNFELFKLHNTNVVIDANNFLNYLYFSSGLWTQFNGEYCALASIICKLIKSFKQCNIKPIFVFDGYHEPYKLRTRIHRNHQRLQDCRIFNGLLKSNKLDIVDQQYCVRILPPSVNLVFIQTLTSLQVDYVTSDTESDQDALSLAIYLKCPVISNDSDFYITIPNSLDVCFIPLNFINLQPIKYINNNCGFCKSNSKLCNYLECQQFLPDGPGLNKLPLIQRPLFASLLGNDHVSSNVFLNGLPGSNDLLIPLNRSANRETYLKRRRTIIKNLINWLSDFNTNRQQPINRILDRFPKIDRPYLLKKLNESINSYETNPSFIFQLFSKYIHLSDIDKNDVKHDDDNVSKNVLDSEDEDLNKIEFINISEVDLHDTDDECNNPDVVNMLDHESEDSDKILFGPSSRNDVDDYEDQTSICSKIDSNDKDNHSILFGDNDISSPVSSPILNESHISLWPENLQYTFRKYLFMPSILDSIYSNGLVNTCIIESFDRESVYLCTESIRCLIYNILLGLELHCFNHNMRQFNEIKILNNNDKVFISQEFRRYGRWIIKPHKIIIEPFDYLWSSDYVEKNPDYDVQFIQKYIGLIFNYEQSNNWLILLSLISVIQHQTKNINKKQNLIEHCVYILAFCTISICTYLLTSNKSDFKSLKHHYLKCTKLFKNKSVQLMKDKKQSFSSIDINAIHNFGQLQIIYSDLISLFRILGCVKNAEKRNLIDTKTLIQIPDSITLFPSGYLYYELCTCLNQLQSNELINFIHNFVIDQLLSVSHSVDRKSIAIDLFNQFLKILQYANDNLCLYKPMSYSEVNRTHKNTKTDLIETMKKNNQSCRIMKSNNKNAHKKTKIQSHKNSSHHEIEERINRIMLENDLSD